MKPELRDLFIFLILEVLSVVWAGVVFSMIPNKIIAGALAGAYFLAFSLYMLSRILKWPNCWRSWTLYPLLLFIFGTVIPMLWVRFTHISQPFSQLRIMGLSAEEFHKASSGMMGLLFVVTLIEAVATMTRGKIAKA